MVITLSDCGVFNVLLAAVISVAMAGLVAWVRERCARAAADAQASLARHERSCPRQVGGMVQKGDSASPNSSGADTHP